MKDLMFFDANCRIGDTINQPGPGVVALLGEMDRFGVDRALVRHANIAAAGALATNASLAAMLRQDAACRLTGVWGALPSQCGELPEPEAFFREMKANRIGALTLSPFEHRYVPCRLTLGRIMDAAAERKIPVLLDAFAGKWDDLYRFVAEFPKNILIYIETYGKWGTDRNIRPLLEHYENFYFETAGYWVPEGIRDLVEQYGANRILYGSGFPGYNQGSSMLQLKHSTMDAASLAQVAGKNLESLLKGAQL